MTNRGRQNGEVGRISKDGALVFFDEDENIREEERKTIPKLLCNNHMKRRHIQRRLQILAHVGRSIWAQADNTAQTHGQGMAS